MEVVKRVTHFDPVLCDFERDGEVGEVIDREAWLKDSVDLGSSLKIVPIDERRSCAMQPLFANKGEAIEYVSLFSIKVF